ncbi:hypothetical protein [Methylobacterium sp. A54F]
MRPAEPERRAWLRPLRLAVRFGLPIVGLLILGHAIVISIGGYIEKGQFALGILFLSLGFTARLIPKR